MASGIIQQLFGPAGQPDPSNPMSKAIARRLGLDDPWGKSAFASQFKSSYPTDISERSGDLYPMMREELVTRISDH